ncbi:MAG: carboxypeptidase-like regulatory domain-containing protein [Acidobacteria bacterium]|nr:carboxypeptidase-like regulatory domain-containing protein [Acidobacteriota bacterium]
MFRIVRPALLLCGCLAVGSHSVLALSAGPQDTMPSPGVGSQGAPAGIRITGQVFDAVNAQPLPGVAVSIDGTSEPVITDVDGRYALTLAPGTHTLTMALDGFQPKTVRVSAEAGRPLELTTSLAVGGFAEQVTVTADVQDAVTSSAAASCWRAVGRQRSPTASDPTRCGRTRT